MRIDLYNIKQSMILFLMGCLIAAFLYVAYLTWWPVKVVSDDFKCMKTQYLAYRAGDMVYYHHQFTKLLPKTARVTVRMFVNGGAYSLVYNPLANLDIGPVDIWNHVKIPYVTYKKEDYKKGTPQKARIELTAVYGVNDLGREETYIAKSNEFWVYPR